MSRFYSPLDDVRVASPCSADWDSMYGDEQRRYCGECKLNVYNLSGMTREAAERLVTESEGRLCVRFYRRPDGTIITQDCPVGWARVKQRTRVYATAAMSLIAALLTGLFAVSLFRRVDNRYPVMGSLTAPTPAPTPIRVMGDYVTMGAAANKREVEIGRMKSDSGKFEKAKQKALTAAGD